MPSGQRPPSTAAAELVPPAPLPVSVAEVARTRTPCTGLTLVSFGFKYGRPPANHSFDVSFLRNPAREAGWDLWSPPTDAMREWVLAQPAATRFLDALVPLARFLAESDDDARLALGCSAGRHRSRILVEELARRLTAEGLAVAVHHREREFARPAEELA